MEKKLNVLQQTMALFLDNYGAKFSNIQLSSGVYVRGEMFKTVYLTDNIKFLKRITMPSGKHIDFDVEHHIAPSGKKYVTYSLKDMLIEDYQFITDLKNITRIQILGEKGKFRSIFKSNKVKPNNYDRINCYINNKLVEGLYHNDKFNAYYSQIDAIEYVHDFNEVKKWCYAKDLKQIVLGE